MGAGVLLRMHIKKILRSVYLLHGTGWKEDSKALVTIDGEGVDWTNHSEDEDYALMAWATLQTQEQSNFCDACIEIKAYSQGLKKVEAQLVAHQQGQLMPPKRTSTSEAPTMTQAAIRKVVADSVQKELLVLSAGLSELNQCFPWNYFAQPIGIEEAYKINLVEFKKLLIKKYCPRTEVQKMEDEFFHLTVKGNDLKTYVRRFQELATLCPTIVPDSEKMMEVFIGGLPQSIEGNVTASKPQNLEEAINIA
ncbi:reverse transcriptase domain-containing protein [Tanacetum coccineum]